MPRPSGQPFLPLFLAFTALSLPTFAQAQFVNPFTGGHWNNPVSSTIDTMIFHDIQRRTLMLPYEREERPDTLPASATSFSPTPGFPAARAFAQSLSDDAEVQQALMALFEHGRDTFETQAHAEGKPNNVALAVSFFIQANYYVYTGGREVSDAAQTSLWAAVHETLAHSPAFPAAHRERQAFYETFVMLAVLPLYGYLDAVQSGDAESVSLFKTLAGQNLELAFGAPPEALRFTEAGLDISR